MVERGSVQHGARLDEALAEVGELPLRGGAMAGREDRDPELPGDDEVPDARAHEAESASGPATDAVRERSELARWLLPSRFPADGTALVALAREEGAPTVVVADLEALPAGLRYETVGEVWRALGGAVEVREGTEPTEVGVDLGDAVAEALAEVAAEVVAEQLGEALVEAAIEDAVEEAIVVEAMVQEPSVPEPPGGEPVRPRAAVSTEWFGPHEPGPSVLAQVTDFTIGVIDLALLPARIGWSIVDRMVRPRRG